MEIIAPTYITDATLISSDISETTEVYPEWDSTYPYVTGQRVVVTDPGIHKIYEAMWGNDNINYYPPDNLSGTPTWWMKISATNLWKLFDLIVMPDRTTVEENIFPTVWETGTIWQTGVVWTSEQYTSMQVTVHPGIIDSIAVLNADATSITIIMKDPVSGIVYNNTSIPPVTTEFNMVIDSLPSYINANITVMFRSTEGTINVGEIIFGSLKVLGSTRYGVNLGLVDYSYKSRNFDGTYSVIERAFSRRSDFDFFTPTATHASVFKILETYRSIPLVWIISDDYSSTIVYGYYRDLKMSLISNAITEGSVSIEGLGADWVNVTPPEDDWVDPWDGHIKLNVLGVPTESVTTSVLEETPTTVPTIELTPVSIPSVNSTFRSYEMIGNCTISNAEPLVVTYTGHGLVEDDMIRIFNTLVLTITNYHCTESAGTYNLIFSGSASVQATGTYTIGNVTSAISNVTWAGASYPPDANGVATYTTSTPHHMSSGDSVTVSVITPTMYNRTGSCTVIDYYNFSLVVPNNPAPTVYSSGGSAYFVGINAVSITTGGVGYTSNPTVQTQTGTGTIIATLGDWRSISITPAPPAQSTVNSIYYYGTNSIPLPLVPQTTYYVVYIDANTFNLSLTIGGSTIDATSAGWGVPTLYVTRTVKMASASHGLTSDNLSLVEHKTLAMDNSSHTLVSTNCDVVEN